MRGTRTWLAAIACAALLCGCGPEYMRTRPATTLELTGWFGGEDGLRLVRSAADVDAYEVAGNSPSTQPATTARVAGFRVVEGPRRLPPAAARELGAALADPNSYAADVGKGCMFNADAATRFTASDGTDVVVVFCFGCNQVWIARNGKRSGFADIDPGRERVRRALATTLPEAAVRWER